jgi:hypothetical protein
MAFHVLTEQERNGEGAGTIYFLYRGLI